MGGTANFPQKSQQPSRRHTPEEMLQVDAFTPVPLAGNPAAVLFTQKGGDEAWMQAVAVENNLAETAFVEARSGGDWNIRWFTPTTEVALCGHATLASAHALWETGRVPRSSPITFHTRTAGTLRCEATGPWIKMDFPAQPPTPAPAASSRAELAKALYLIGGGQRSSMSVQQ